MSKETLVKVSVLRNFRSGIWRGIKGKDLELPADLAAALAKGDKPAVKPASASR